jgi:hypothetical protein
VVVHLDPIGVVEYRIRKLEVVLEIIRDAGACSSIYVKANLCRGIMERLLEDDLADASLPALLLIVSRHHAQDLKFLRRSEKHTKDVGALATYRKNIAKTIALRESSRKQAEELAGSVAPESASRTIYEALKKHDTVEERAKAVYTPEVFERFYADYAALSQFVHGGNRETLMVTTERGDLAPLFQPIADQMIAEVKRLVEERLAVLRNLPRPGPEPRKVAPIGYDPELEFRRISVDNWLQPDMSGYFPGLTAGSWITTVLEPQLGKHVPLEIVRLFEVARGAMVYGWFFYPLTTLAAEQNHRVMEAAAKLRSTQIGHPNQTFARSLRYLIETGIISEKHVVAWEATRGLRNSGSHPKRQQIWDPGSAHETLKSSAELINRLFKGAVDAKPGDA